MTIAAVAIGGAIGSVLRYMLQIQCVTWFGSKFPYGTLLVNTIGSLLIGFLSIYLLDKLAVGSELRFAILVGLLGGFTTFSTFSLETVNLIQQGNLVSAASNIVLSVILCVAACYFGVILARAI